jgi:hypothetical protein
VTDLRADVVAAIVAATTSNLPAVIEASSPSPSELHAAADLLADLAKSELEQAGAIRPSRSVLDLDCAHIRSIAAVWDVIHKWWPQPGVPNRLGDLCKVMPADDVRTVMLALAIGGLVDPASVSPPDG